MGEAMILRMWRWHSEKVWVVEVPVDQSRSADLGQFDTEHAARGAWEKWAADRHLRLIEIDDFPDFKTWRVETASLPALDTGRDDG